jgi:hypothetical protein
MDVTIHSIHFCYSSNEASWLRKISFAGKYRGVGCHLALQTQLNLKPMRTRHIAPEALFIDKHLKRNGLNLATL